MTTTQPQPERRQPHAAAAVGDATQPHADCVVIGGGGAGLWTAATLAKKGYSVLLIERDTLGAGQTVASQGILHGGIKYTLGGKATEAARAVAAMPARWHAAMTGNSDADPDLRAVTTLCPAQYLWTTTSLFSKVTAMAAAAAIRTQVRAVEPAQACEALHNATKVSIHQVDEPVIDPRSLIEALSQQFNAAGGVAVQVWDDYSINAKARTVRIRERTVRFSTLVLAAGEGNALLLHSIGVHAPVMQRRPLHMVMARPTGDGTLPRLFGHCIAAMSDKPRITVTTQADRLPGGRERNVWYIGGQIAESGVARSRDQQIAAARAEVAACLPWIDLRSTQWAAFTINRAEGSTPSGERPDTPVVAPVGPPESGIVAVWPTKLVFAPLVADRVCEHVARFTHPSDDRPEQSGLDQLTRVLRPGVALLPWDRGDLTWT